MNPKVTDFIARAPKWQAEMDALRTLIQTFPFDEDIKWGKPCYSYQGTNLLVMQPFKAYFALMFFNGALLKDEKSCLTPPGENSQSGRQLRVTSVQEINKLKPVIKAYIRESIEAKEAGLKVEFKKNPEPHPEELQAAFKKKPALEAAFNALTPGRQRGYILHFKGAKQSATRASRIEKCVPQILAGKGMHD